MKLSKSELGFTIIEMVLIMGLSLVFLLGTSALFYIAIKSSDRASLISQAKALAQEGMEALIAIRDLDGSEWDWSTTPENTASSEYYQPYFSTSSWILGAKTTTSPPPTLPSPHNRFTRIVTIESAQRSVGCGSQICPIVLSGGVIDNNTRKVTVKVNWEENDGIHTASISSYLIRWR